MTRRYLALACLIVLGASPVTAQEPAKAGERLKILDAQPRFILLAGGPQLAKGADARRFINLVERYYANKCPHTIEVWEPTGKVKGNVPGIAEAMLPALRKARERKLPIVVLAHLPPLVTKPAAEVLIRHDKDAERIKAYGDLFAGYAQTLRKGGADLVVLGMEGAVGPDKSDPRAEGTYGHLHLVSDEIVRRSLPGVVVGPRVFATFDKHRHLYLRKDHHITAQGRSVVSHLWFQALCNVDGVAIPEWSQKELAALLSK